MLITRILCGLILVAILLPYLSCKPTADLQKEFPENLSVPDLMQILANQPDHTADWILSTNLAVMVEGKEPDFYLTYHIKFAKKKGKTRQEFYPIEDAEKLKNEADRFYSFICITQPGQPPLLLDPQAKIYTESGVLDDCELHVFSPYQLTKDAIDKNFLGEEIDTIKILNVETVSMDGHEVAKVKLIFIEEGEEYEEDDGYICLYFAKDMKNMLIKAEDNIDLKEKTMTARSSTITNISFEVDDELFEIPDDYKRVDFDWETVSNEKVVK